MKKFDEAFLGKIAFLTHFKLVLKAFLSLAFLAGVLLGLITKEPLNALLLVLEFSLLFLFILFGLTLLYCLFKLRHYQP